MGLNLAPCIEQNQSLSVIFIAGAGSAPIHARSPLGLERDQPEDHVAVALAWAEQGAQLAEGVRLEPDQPLAVVVGLAFEADRTQ